MTDLRIAHRAQRGVSIVEVLVAVVVLAIGFLGIVALQIQGVRSNVDSYARSQAVTLANDYAERIYANKPAVDTGGYGALDSNLIDCATAPDQICATQSDKPTPDECTAAQMATYDRFVLSCGFPTSGSSRYGGVKDLLQSGRIQATCLNAAGAATAMCCFNLAGTNVACTDPPPLSKARHLITVSWREQVKGANNLTTWQDASYQMTVRP